MERGYGRKLRDEGWRLGLGSARGMGNRPAKQKARAGSRGGEQAHRLWGREMSPAGGIVMGGGRLRTRCWKRFDIYRDLSIIPLYLSVGVNDAPLQGRPRKKPRSCSEQWPRPRHPLENSAGLSCPQWQPPKPPDFPSHRPRKRSSQCQATTSCSVGIPRCSPGGHLRWADDAAVNILNSTLEITLGRWGIAGSRTCRPTKAMGYP